MRLATLAALASLAAAPAAFAEPVYEAHSAMGACLAAVIDKAPVVDAKGQDVAVHRETAPNLCAVTVSAGDPSEVRRSVLDAVAARPERFGPAKTAWAAGALASRETLCSWPPWSRRGRATSAATSTWGWNSPEAETGFPDCRAAP